MNIKETIYEGVNWIHFTQDREYSHDLVPMVIKLQVPYDKEFLDHMSDHQVLAKDSTPQSYL
jgi:hypothetical protein